jgi:hypothetical protein
VPLRHGLGDGLRLGGVGDVEGQGAGVWVADAGEFLGGGLGGGEVEVCHDNGVVPGRELGGDGAPDARPGTSDDGDLLGHDVLLLASW